MAPAGWKEWLRTGLFSLAAALSALPVAAGVTHHAAYFAPRHVAALQVDCLPAPSRVHEEFGAFVHFNGRAIRQPQNGVSARPATVADNSNIPATRRDRDPAQLELRHAADLREPAQDERGHPDRVRALIVEDDGRLTDFVIPDGVDIESEKINQAQWYRDYLAQGNVAGGAPSASLWLIGEDGQRHRLTQDFPITFYAAGEPARLRLLWRFLQSQPEKPELKRTARRDVFFSHPVDVLEVTVNQTAAQPFLFQRAAREFPELAYYDADLPITTRHAAIYNTFPLVHCQLEVDEQGHVQALKTLDTPWELDPPAPPLRLLALETDVDPSHANPTALYVRSLSVSYRFSLEHPRSLLVNLRAIFQRQDPDVLLTSWGDTWLLPYLLELAEQWHLALPLNREPGREVIRKEERSYQAYGQVIYRGRQVHLFGRWHIDHRAFTVGMVLLLLASSLYLAFSGLTTGTKYLGSVAYGGASGMPNPTIVRVDP